MECHIKNCHINHKFQEKDMDVIVGNWGKGK